MPPYVVVEGSGVAVAVAQVRDAGWAVRPGWAADGPAGVVLAGVVHDGASAAAALLAALAGAGLVVDGRAGRDVLDRLCEDLRRLGRVDHRLPGDRSWPAVEPEERELVDLLAAGLSLGAAAAVLHLSRRTADRRLASVRRRLGVTTTAEALVAARRQLPPVEAPPARPDGAAGWRSSRIPPA